MINRYSRPEMANIWTEENKYKAWLAWTMDSPRLATIRRSPELASRHLPSRVMIMLPAGTPVSSDRTLVTRSVIVLMKILTQ